MVKNPLNTNKQFMIGNGILAFSVIFVVVLFIYMSMRLQVEKKGEHCYSETYLVELASGFTGDSISIYINDSLLLNTLIRKDSLKLEITRFAEQNALLIVENSTEKISTFDLSKKGGHITVTRKEGNIYLNSSPVH